MLEAWIKESLDKRNQLSQALFQHEAPRLAALSQQMSERFSRGGRLYCFGKASYMTDAQHLAVEFVHPVIVGKRALPALDISAGYEGWLKASLKSDDIVVGFAPPKGDADNAALLEWARHQDALCVALSGTDSNYSLMLSDHEPFIQQELIEVVYHTLWETVHVFFEHQNLGHDLGASSFLYPFLGDNQQDTSELITTVAQSIQQKARDVELLRQHFRDRHSSTLTEIIISLEARLKQGGRLIAVGNGGSATDANDLVFDCLMPPPGMKPIAALSLALEGANLSAIANDIGVDVMFQRQLIAQAQQGDILVAFSTSGSSQNIVASLKQARKQGLMTLAFLGSDGGEIVRQQLADIYLLVPTDYIPRIQEAHASLYHIIREGLGKCYV